THSCARSRSVEWPSWALSGSPRTAVREVGQSSGPVGPFRGVHAQLCAKSVSRVAQLGPFGESTHSCARSRSVEWPSWALSGSPRTAAREVGQSSGPVGPFRGVHAQLRAKSVSRVAQLGPFGESTHSCARSRSVEWPSWALSGSPRTAAREVGQSSGPVGPFRGVHAQLRAKSV